MLKQKFEIPHSMIVSPTCLKRKDPLDLFVTLYSAESVLPIVEYHNREVKLNRKKAFSMDSINTQKVKAAVPVSTASLAKVFEQLRLGDVVMVHKDNSMIFNSCIERVYAYNYAFSYCIKLNSGLKEWISSRRNKHQHFPAVNVTTTNPNVNRPLRSSFRHHRTKSMLYLSRIFLPVTK